MRELIIISTSVEPSTDHSYRATYSINLNKVIDLNVVESRFEPM